MVLHQNVINFLHAALECSIYVCPTDPGLTVGELSEAAKRAKFLEGEIADSIPQIAVQSFGRKDQKIQLDKNHALILTMFHATEDPDYRNADAIHSVFEAMRQLVREKGVANAQIERSCLIEKMANGADAEHDIQIAIAILNLNEILSDKDGIISFVRGKEQYGSPGDPGNIGVARMGTIRKEARAHAYPIVKKLIEERSDPTHLGEAKKPDALALRLVDNKSNDEWLSAAAALDLLGRGYYSGTRAICKRARSGLVAARAKRFTRDSQTTDNVEVPHEFWWAEGEAALKQDWTAGDFDTWSDHKHHLRAFGVEFRRSDIEDMKTKLINGSNMENGPIFIGHGHSTAWMTLRDLLRDRLQLSVDEYNVVPTAGISTVERLKEMLDAAKFAFLVMTAEDEQKDGSMHARENVIHEAGLFQGRLGFRKAIILLEIGCSEISNIAGLGQIRFERANMQAKFEDVRGVLERERIIPKAPTIAKPP